MDFASSICYLSPKTTRDYFTAQMSVSFPRRPALGIKDGKLLVKATILQISSGNWTFNFVREIAFVVACI